MKWKFNEVNYYKDLLVFKDIIKDVNLDHTDEALYVCDLSVVAEKFHQWQRKLPRVQPYYAVKCNDDNVIVKTLADLGTCFDCASKTEIKQVLELGVTPERIIFANPCKPVTHLNYAEAHGVTTSTVDNEFEIYKIFKHYPQSNLVVRFRCEAKDAQCPLGDKFGCDVTTDVSALMLLAQSLQLNVTGTSFHVGSGCNDLPAYDRAISSAQNISKFGEFLGYEMNLVDIGGGFPGSDNKKFDSICDIINTSLEKHFPDDTVRIIAEPGRYFVAAAFTLLCKIHAKREVRPSGKLDTKMYYINDGVYGSFNCILYDHQHVTVEHFLDDEDGKLPKFKSLIWGPTCDALDKIIEDLYLPDLSCGDFIAFPNMGAYTVPVASPFNGFLLPKTLYFQQSSRV